MHHNFKKFEITQQQILKYKLTPRNIFKLIFYRVAEVANPNEEAWNYITWLKTRLKVIEVDCELTEEAG